MRSLASLACVLLVSILPAQDRLIRLPRQPQISPDGQTLVFTWQKDLWTAASTGGDATRLTHHPASDSNAFFSPDGAQIAFISDRSGGSQIHMIPVSGGMARQITKDSNRKTLFGWTSEGRGLVIAQSTDRGWNRSQSTRLFVLDLSGQQPKRILFDAGFSEASLSPSGDKVLFTLGRAAWNRKGYTGAAATQLWLADLNTTPATLTRLDEDRPHFQNVSLMKPMWTPDSSSYYYMSDPDGGFDIYRGTLGTSERERITKVGEADGSDDGVAFPSISRDGKTMLFRRRFDLQRLDLSSGKITELSFRATGDLVAGASERRTETSASAIAFTEDGKQMAFVSGEDVYVMDRILKEPVRITNNAFQETSLCFSKDGKRLFFVSDASGEMDIWEATHSQEDGIWWLAEDFALRQVTDDRAVESALSLSPEGELIAFNRDTDLYVMKDDGSESRQIVSTWNTPSFAWAPDGKWLTYATQDSDYNSDIWVVPVDGSREPHNLSRHPDRDTNPVWSGDGTKIAFVSRRNGSESDIYYINLTKQEEEKTDRDKKLEEAIAAMKNKGPAKASGSDRPGNRRGTGRRGRGGRGRPTEPTTEPTQEPETDTEDSKQDDESEEEKEPVVVTIDFDGIHDRMHRITIADSQERGLIWSPDGKKLAFTATIKGESGFYAVEFPDLDEPSKLADTGLGNARWLKGSNEIVGTSRPARGGARRGRGRGRGGFGGGTPAAMTARGKLTSFSFSLRRTRDWHQVRQISFDQGWRAMRDRFYDPEMNNRDWNAIREKYRPVAAQCLGASEFSELMNMMLGELNASHMRHSGGTEPLPRPQAQNAWSPTTYHLGMRFDPNSKGPGLLVESVIPGSPASEKRSLVEVGETLLAIDGAEVGPEIDLEAIMTIDEIRDMKLTVRNAQGTERTVTLRPSRSVQGLLYPEWIEGNRKIVDELSGGKLGYLHIRGMNMPSFLQMEEDLYHAGHGKEGLIIDVRFNGGGSTTDHVMTVLTQPQHAITRSRGSNEGYPQDRKVYASWTKPIVLMCNEYSFSNAEILSHAVKQVGRGRIVGMRTAGGVISTGSARLLDGSTVRMPRRGWYLVSTGEDMELNGCEPDIALWNPPGGEDLQLQAAVKALAEDVAREQAMGGVMIVPASAKRLREGK